MTPNAPRVPDSERYARAEVPLEQLERHLEALADDAPYHDLDELNGASPRSSSSLDESQRALFGKLHGTWPKLQAKSLQLAQTSGNKTRAVSKTPAGNVLWMYDCKQEVLH